MTLAGINASGRLGSSPGWFQMPLRDGTVGYLQRHTDGCLQATIASLLQLHLVPELVPPQETFASWPVSEVAGVCGWDQARALPDRPARSGGARLGPERDPTGAPDPAPAFPFPFPFPLPLRVRGKSGGLAGVFHTRRPQDAPRGKSARAARIFHVL